MMYNTRFLYGFLITVALFHLGNAFYPSLYQLCCQGIYSPWQGYNHYRHMRHVTYTWPESSFHRPHYFFKPPLAYYHYDPCRNYNNNCHITQFHKCCYDCCGNLRCTVNYKFVFTSPSRTTSIMDKTTIKPTTKETTVENTTPEVTTNPTTEDVDSTTPSETTVITTEEITTITTEEITPITTEEITTITTEEITTMQNTTPEVTTKQIDITSTVNGIDPESSGSGDGSGDESGDGSVGGSGDGSDGGSGDGSDITTTVKAPGIQRRHIIWEDEDTDDFLFEDDFMNKDVIKVKII